MSETPIPRPTWNADHPPLRAVLFDLDGTLLETIGDIALALNRTLGTIGLAPLREAVVRDMVGRGSAMLLARALEAAGYVMDAAGQGELLERFFAEYERLQDEGTSVARPYPGAAEAVATLARRGVPLAVVTNKQQAIAVRTLAGVGLLEPFGCVVGGDTCARRKPHPEPLLHACGLLGVAPGETLMVGDSLNDVSAARAAGMRVLCVPYGYNEGQDPRELPCDGFLETLAGLPAIIPTGPRT